MLLLLQFGYSTEMEEMMLGNRQKLPTPILLGPRRTYALFQDAGGKNRHIVVERSQGSMTDGHDHEAGMREWTKTNAQ